MSRSRRYRIMAVEFLPGDALRDAEQFLRHEPFELPERLFLEDGADLPVFPGMAFSKNQLPHVVQQRIRLIS